MPVPLSKSRYLSGLQCHKQLWWRVHDPDAPELIPDENTKVLFAVGAQVGAAARAFVPGGVLILGKANEGPLKVERTLRALEEGAQVVYEATFEHEGVFVSIDLLERVGGGFRLTEVKSTTEQKKEHLPDVAVQTWVARGARLAVVGSRLMHLNRECRAPDLSNLFARADVGGEVGSLLAEVPGQVAAMKVALESPTPPEVPIGDHCDEPFECPFKSRCWPVLPEHHITTLPRLSPKKKQALVALGVETIDQIPADFVLTDTQERQRQAVVQGKMLIDPALAGLVKTYWGARTAFLDFETVSPAIPIWDGTNPYAQVPAQFSCHLVDGRRVGEAQHIQWIADGPHDPRPAFADAVIEACRGAELVVVFNAAFERGRLEALAGALPHRREALLDIVRRIKDLADPIRRGLIYHPKFYGSFSLKKVVPALIPEYAYDDLDVSDGTTASNRLLAMMLNEPPLTDEERAARKKELLAYCERDTWVMVKLLEKMEELAVS